MTTTPSPPPSSPSKYLTSDGSTANTPRKRNNTAGGVSKRRESYPGDNNTTGSHHDSVARDSSIVRQHQQQQQQENQQQQQQENEDHDQPPLQQQEHTINEFRLPLTWDEARSRLRMALERWKNEHRQRSRPSFAVGTSISAAGGNHNNNNNSTAPLNNSQNNNEHHHDNNLQDTTTTLGNHPPRQILHADRLSKLVPKCLGHVKDPDMVLLAIPLSLVFVILSFLLPQFNLDNNPNNNSHSNTNNNNNMNNSRSNENNNCNSTHQFHKMQQAAALLFLLSSIISTWITRRRRKVSTETDGSIERRRCVAAFLDGMREKQQQHQQQQQQQQQQQRNGQQETRPPTPSSLFNASKSDLFNLDVIPRKNVEDVYSTYRLGWQQHQILAHDDHDDGNNNDNVGTLFPGTDAKSTTTATTTNNTTNNAIDNTATIPTTDQGQWHRIPSLLLVKGDFIALKVGDTAPAKCRPVMSWGAAANTMDRTNATTTTTTTTTTTKATKATKTLSTSTKHNNNSNPSTDVIEAGERLTINSLSAAAKETLVLPSSPNNNNSNNTNNNSSTTKSSGSKSTAGNGSSSNGGGGNGILPLGRSTLKYGSEEFLLLANGVQIYVLLETPLDSFLRRKDVAKRKTPQMIRQGQAIRATFLYAAVIAFTLTLLFLLVRPDGAKSFFLSTTWTLPLLAALSVLPVMTPMYVFLLECIGTARILATVHPLASTQKTRFPNKGMSENVGGVDSSQKGGGGIVGSDDPFSPDGGVDKPPLKLLFRYMMATSSSRLFTESPMKALNAWRRRKAYLLSSSHTHASTGSNNQSKGGGAARQSFESTPDALLSIPPASLHLLEKLGVVTALTLIDDELACEPFSTPQQLLIPSGQGGLKLLDLCPVFDDDDAYSTDNEDNETSNHPSSSRNSIGGSRHQSRQNSDVYSIDSDDEPNDETLYNHALAAPARTLQKIRGTYRKRKRAGGRRELGNTGVSTSETCQQCRVDDDGEVEVQFEDPQFWMYLPSLKCIGLGCLLVDEGIVSKDNKRALAPENQFDHVNPTQKVSFGTGKSARNQPRGRNPRVLTPPEISLVDHLCHERERPQLRMLARCIGFDTTPNEFGARGDLSCFNERRRLHIISTSLLRKRMQLESHSLGLEECRNWSRLFTDATTVFVQDSRSGADQVLTVGDARIVTELCPDWWQGENSTISPLTSSDRKIINETSKNWMLSDLDVVAFSYAPLPYTADHKIGWGSGRDSHIYLMNNHVESATSSSGGSVSSSTPGTGFWSLVKNQIFLGLLGSSVRPRKEIEPLIDACAKAGVRWVYFSPRNMRRTKELASQMGIDVAWNCAISLRPLEEGTDDNFRMTSNYADWDVNAKLPHGVEDVKRHLEEVDNVPLLVSLYTDVTKDTTAEMVNVFQDYHDTVLSVGLSHLPRNQEIFSRSDIAIGVDVLAEEVSFSFQNNSNDCKPEWNALLSDEVAFVTSISAYSSVFNLLGSHSTCHLLQIIRIGRASFEAVTSAVGFVLVGYLSFGMFILLCPCTAATAVPIIPALGSFLYTQIILLLIGLSMATTDEDKESMSRVPPKNDSSSSFSLKESKRIYLSGILRAAPIAIIPQLLYLIALGELMWEFDSPFVAEYCLTHSNAEVGLSKPPIAAILRCEALRNYSGPAKVSAGTIMLASLAICTCVSSASFVFRTEPIRSEPPWKRNRLWVGSLIVSFILIAFYLGIILEKGSMTALPVYFYVLFLVTPFLCLFLSEAVKTMNQKDEKRAVMMRRLQFETRLGMWSPKESSHMLETPNFRANRSPIV